jgi:hypothetical protein
VARETCILGRKKNMSIKLFAKIAIILAVMPPFAPAQNPRPKVERVLLISIDGMHALDLTRYIKDYPDSVLARLSQRGIIYTNAWIPSVSDTMPGMVGLATGGTPNSTGVFWDTTYDRTLSPPGSDCSKVGTKIDYSEQIDKDVNDVEGGGGIDPAKLPLNPANGCKPVFPHSFLRVNTIFEVVKASGGRTAWSDVHWPFGEIMNGPSGDGVNDLYIPEILADGRKANKNMQNIEAYDEFKLQAILHEIDGQDHSGTKQVGVPTLFGMNFQAMVPGEKFFGGYLDGSGTPSPALLDAMKHTDECLGKLVEKLKAKGLYDSTMIVVTSKHGQSPMDPIKRNVIPNTVADTVESVKKGILAAYTAETISLIWLTDQSRTEDVAAALRNRTKELEISKIYFGESLKLRFNDPKTDPRTPDIIIQPNLGVFYAGKRPTNIEEHGGFNEDDTNVALMISAPGANARVIKSHVETTQVAPTILKALGLDPNALKAVQLEGTVPLPGL